MKVAYLEHINMTVADPDQAAKLLCDIFDWNVRWSGEAKEQGYTVHVGSDVSYLALYRPVVLENKNLNHRDRGKVNHLGIVVDKLDDLEQKVLSFGLTSFNHGDYEPGKRFYFKIDDIEVEVVSYDD